MRITNEVISGLAEAGNGRMYFIDKVRRLSGQFPENLEYLQTKETTKTVLVLPFLYEHELQRVQAGGSQMGPVSPRFQKTRK